jgi:hypothetical protein
MSYKELTTPLSLMIFGAIEYIFQKGIFGGRLFNLLLSIWISWRIAWPSPKKHQVTLFKPLLCLLGLYMCPQFLMYSGRLYTEMVACSLVLLGTGLYVQNRHFLSALLFALAVSTRQYTIVFPAAIFIFEFLQSLPRVSSEKCKRFLPQLIPAACLLAWGFFFYNLDNETQEKLIRRAPVVQHDIWSIRPGAIINFLAAVGIYLVVPEFLLLTRKTALKGLRKNLSRFIVISLALLVYMFFFPPISEGFGLLLKTVRRIPYTELQFIVYYCLALLACIRFSRPSLISTMVAINGLIMLKAQVWDKYLVPLAVVFWFLKSIDYPEKRIGELEVTQDEAHKGTST